MSTTWWSEDEATYWVAVEEQMVALSHGTEDGTRNLVRSDTGRRLLTRLRRHRASTLGIDDPFDLARAAHVL